MLGSGTQKQRTDLLSSSAASFTKTKARLSTPWAGLGWITVCQRGWKVSMCVPPFTTSLPYHLFHSLYSLPAHEIINVGLSPSQPSFHFQKAHCIPSLLLWTVGTPTQMHINTAVTYDSADVRVDQNIGWQMLWANLAAPDCAKATRHSKALNTRSDGSNCSNGIILWNSFKSAAWQN